MTEKSETYNQFVNSSVSRVVASHAKDSKIKLYWRQPFWLLEIFQLKWFWCKQWKLLCNTKNVNLSANFDDALMQKNLWFATGEFYVHSMWTTRPHSVVWQENYPLIFPVILRPFVILRSQTIKRQHCFLNSFIKQNNILGFLHVSFKQCQH